MLNIPQLYLFSETDSILLLPTVYRILQEQRAMGRDVSSHIWKDAIHVQLYFGPIPKLTQLRYTIYANLYYNYILIV